MKLCRSLITTHTGVDYMQPERLNLRQKQLAENLLLLSVTNCSVIIEHYSDKSRNMLISSTYGDLS